MLQYINIKLLNLLFIYERYWFYYRITWLEIDLASLLTDDELAAFLIDLGLDAATAIELAHKYHQCKMGILLP